MVPLASSPAPTITYSDLLDMEYAVDRAYRVGNEGGMGGFTGRAAGINGWMMSDTMEKTVRSMVDLEGRPLWTPGIMAGTFGLVEGRPQRLLEYRYQVNNAMDAFALGATAGNTSSPLIFGAFGYYGCRTVADMQIYRFWDSRTAQAHSIEVLGFMRADSRPIGAITSGSTTCDAYAKLTYQRASA